MPGAEEDSSLATDDDRDPRFRLTISSVASRFSPRVFFCKSSTFLMFFDGVGIGVDITGVVGTDLVDSRVISTSWMVSLNSLYRDWAQAYN